ncbi:uncharacterized protein LOC125038328 [Penaeus chinensis]|uniref:uncharacterized protein LOC125038328 n=1 Tax=Penaeus chinensis TaxID=139456 RepID=UPI001FB7FF8B|nr:uncharacterized protein LOC125038328 [Penaeus chinensis]
MHIYISVLEVICFVRWPSTAMGNKAKAAVLLLVFIAALQVDGKPAPEPLPWGCGRWGRLDCYPPPPPEPYPYYPYKWGGRRCHDGRCGKGTNNENTNEVHVKPVITVERGGR